MKGKKTGGRKPGSLNKTTAAVKDMIETALNRAGGAAYLTRMAKQEPAAFMTLLGKVIPKDMHIKGTGGGLSIGIFTGPEAREIEKRLRAEKAEQDAGA